MSVEPSPDCPICVRLHDFIASWRLKEPGWHNAPVPTFLPVEGPDSVRLLIVGLAPGLRGANRTGRPFTGDYAGDLLYGTLDEFGFSRGKFAARPDDGLELIGAAITNAVRCVPPENKPVGGEISNCRRFLTPTIGRFGRLRAIVTLGTIAHQSTVRAMARPVARHPFSHGGQSDIGSVRLFSSYHCSRYNTNTGRLTEQMFRSVFANVRDYLDGIENEA
ncbi:uracil-DNA glycosylase [Phyllobacterium sp. 0TCS1.6C]|uniref:uracil-DNA glycosylase n=1 Tax=unclassified Phyllobacterium TaxID=2638441 RepID=UPI0022643D8E|nr:MULTISPECIES: uracil-DNA glycosylase [unclassified Phyllobacterium]MCX8280564.1 uracil-DNA glycosylase [Phyllobacterium sp. 0TCS1.6C]MCX8294987.1 uracil-DNA glycosylase [Phyllobacterium sp. 0TCS1.6A]